MLRDHQGNARIHFSDINNDGTITVNESVQESYQKFGYYPYGMQYDKDVHPFPNTLDNVVPKMRYRYTAKEDLRDVDFDVVDFGARLYNPYIGRFFGADPLNINYSQWNPYDYTINNPIKWIDPTGRGLENIILRDKDNTEWKIKAAGRDREYNIPVNLGSNKTIDTILNTVDPNRFVIGYTYQVDLSGGIGGFAQYGLEISVARFTDESYSGYNYVYAGGHINPSFGAQIGYSASVGGSVFIAYNDDGKPIDPKSFAGNTYSMSISADIKAIAGGGVGIGGFSSVEHPFAEKGWKGLFFGISIGAGQLINMLSIGNQTSKTVLLNNVIPTSERTSLDILSNRFAPIKSAMATMTISGLQQMLTR